MKSVNSIAYQTPQFSVLSESQIRDIHLAALEVLRRTGIRFRHREALDMLREAGAFISDGNLVKFPARLVEDAIASTPGRIVMCDRDGQPAMFLEGSKVYFGLRLGEGLQTEPATASVRRPRRTKTKTLTNESPAGEADAESLLRIRSTATEGKAVV